MFPTGVSFVYQSSVDFPPAYQDWKVTDPLDLFQAPIVKNEANPKVLLFVVCFYFFLYAYPL